MSHPNHTIVTGPYPGHQGACVAQYNHYGYSHTANTQSNQQHHSNPHSINPHYYPNYQHHILPHMHQLHTFHHQYGIQYW